MEWPPKAREAGAVIWPTASQPWDSTPQAGWISHVGATSGSVRRLSDTIGGWFFPKELPDAAPTGADEHRMPSASHGWLAVGYTMSPLPWLRKNSLTLG